MIRVSETVYSLDAFLYGIKVMLEDQVSLKFFASFFSTYKDRIIFVLRFEYRATTD